MQYGAWDLTMADYPRLPDENSDDRRIMRAVADCAGGVLYFPKGVYEIASMLTVSNCCSLLLHKSAVLKAVRQMPFVLKIDAAASRITGRTPPEPRRCPRPVRRNKQKGIKRFFLYCFSVRAGIETCCETNEIFGVMPFRKGDSV